MLQFRMPVQMIDLPWRSLKRLPFCWHSYQELLLLGAIKCYRRQYSGMPHLVYHLHSPLEICGGNTPVFDPFHCQDRSIFEHDLIQTSMLSSTKQLSWSSKAGPRISSHSPQDWEELQEMMMSFQIQQMQLNILIYYHQFWIHLKYYYLPYLH